MYTYRVRWMEGCEELHSGCGGLWVPVVIVAMGEGEGGVGRAPWNCSERRSLGGLGLEGRGWVLR